MIRRRISRSAGQRNENVSAANRLGLVCNDGGRDSVGHSEAVLRSKVGTVFVSAVALHGARTR